MNEAHGYTLNPLWKSAGQSLHEAAACGGGDVEESELAPANCAN